MANQGAVQEQVQNDLIELLARKDISIVSTDDEIIGQNMNNPTNTGQTEEPLHNRDQPTYASGSAGQSTEHAWVYSGLCYADKVYGE